MPEICGKVHSTGFLHSRFSSKNLFKTKEDMRNYTRTQLFNTFVIHTVESANVSPVAQLYSYCLSEQNS